MTPEEKIEKIRELEKAFLARIEDIKKEYTQKMRELVAEVEKKKLEDVKKELGI